MFLEPEGRDTHELYVQGFSTGLPERLQLQLLRTLPGAPCVRSKERYQELNTSATNVEEAGHIK